MQIPTAASAMAAFATFVRERLAEVGSSLGPLVSRRDGPEPRGAHDPAAFGAARHLAMAIIGAAAPFAPTSHARARLLRQAHASGLLSAAEADRAIAADQLALTGGRDG